MGSMPIVATASERATGRDDVAARRSSRIAINRRRQERWPKFVSSEPLSCLHVEMANDEAELEETVKLMQERLRQAEAAASASTTVTSEATTQSDPGPGAAVEAPAIAGSVPQAVVTQAASLPEALEERIERVHERTHQTEPVIGIDPPSTRATAALPADDPIAALVRMRTATAASSAAASGDATSIDTLVKQLLRRVVASPPPPAAMSEAALEALVTQLQERLHQSGSQEGHASAASVARTAALPPPAGAQTASSPPPPPSPPPTPLSAASGQAADPASLDRQADKSVGGDGRGSHASERLSPPPAALTIPQTRQRTQEMVELSGNPNAPSTSDAAGLPGCAVASATLLRTITAGGPSCSAASVHVAACCNAAPPAACPLAAPRLQPNASVYGDASAAVSAGSLLVSLLVGFVFGVLFERFRRRRQRQCSPVAPASAAATSAAKCTSPTLSGTSIPAGKPKTLGAMKADALRAEPFDGFHSAAAGGRDMSTPSPSFSTPLQPERPVETEWEPFASAERPTDRPPSLPSAKETSQSSRPSSVAVTPGTPSSMSTPCPRSKPSQDALDDLWKSASRKALARCPK